MSINSNFRQNIFLTSSKKQCGKCPLSIDGIFFIPRLCSKYFKKTSGIFLFSRISHAISCFVCYFCVILSIKSFPFRQVIRKLLTHKQEIIFELYLIFHHQRIENRDKSQYILTELRLWSIILGYTKLDVPCGTDNQRTKYFIFFCKSMELGLVKNWA